MLGDGRPGLWGKGGNLKNRVVFSNFSAKNPRQPAHLAANNQQSAQPSKGQEDKGSRQGQLRSYHEGGWVRGCLFGNRRKTSLDRGHVSLFLALANALGQHLGIVGSGLCGWGRGGVCVCVCVVGEGVGQMSIQSCSCPGKASTHRRSHAPPWSGHSWPSSRP